VDDSAVAQHRAAFARLVSDPSGRLDGNLDEGALRIAAVVNPAVDVNHESRRLDALADEMTATSSAELALELFASGRFSGNGANYYEPENSMLPEVLDRGVGIPILLSVLFIEVGRRRDLEIDGVGMPGHFLTRSGDSWFDPFHAGGELDAPGCQAVYQRLAGRPVQLPAGALDPTPPAKILERMLWNLRSIADGRSDAALARGVLALLSTFPGASLQVRMGWALSLAEAGQFDEAARTARASAELASGDAKTRLQRQADTWQARLN
jgi:regulator of sirC expression with transglutaminase-like and TPR domain